MIAISQLLPTWNSDRRRRGVDGSGYAARLIVLPTFGCALHEDRTPNEGEEKP